MLPKIIANSDTTARSDKFILALTTIMLATFIKLFEEHNDLGKISGKKIREKTWMIYCKAIQKKYEMTKYIKIKNLKLRLDHL